MSWLLTGLQVSGNDHCKHSNLFRCKFKVTKDLLLNILVDVDWYISIFMQRRSLFPISFVRWRPFLRIFTAIDLTWSNMLNPCAGEVASSTKTFHLERACKRHLRTMTSAMRYLGWMCSWSTCTNTKTIQSKHRRPLLWFKVDMARKSAYRSSTVVKQNM